MEPAPVHVLVVDDDPGLVGLLQCALELEGYRVQVAQDGRSARQALEVERPHVVLLDLMMPGIDGLDLCAWIRAHEAPHEHLPIIVMTALKTRAYEALSYARGADDYLAKPFVLTDLVAKIKLWTQRLDGVIDYAHGQEGTDG
jgi:two-component system alkaline phosphatase synthesis response regulator PhoP